MEAIGTYTAPHTPGSPDGDPTYNDRMIAKAEGRTYVPGEKPPVTAVAPQADPAKVDEPVDYKKLYEEMVAKQETPPAKTAEEIAAAAAAEAAKTPEEKAAEAALANQGLNLADFNKEYQETGALSADSYKKLEAKGIDKATVDAYIAGQTALAEANANKLYDIVSGPDRYAEMLTWAKDNLTKEQAAAYNAAVTSGDMAKAELAVKGLNAQFTENVGNPPSGLLNGGAGGGQAGDSFASKAEMTAAMKDPRYEKDSAYRASVEQKLSRSKIF